MASFAASQKKWKRDPLQAAVADADLGGGSPISLGRGPARYAGRSSVSAEAGWCTGGPPGCSEECSARARFVCSAVVRVRRARPRRQSRVPGYRARWPGWRRPAEAVEVSSGGMGGRRRRRRLRTVVDGPCARSGTSVRHRGWHACELLPGVLSAIEQAVTAAEQRTSGEIRFAIETALDLPDPASGHAPRERARSMSSATCVSGTLNSRTAYSSMY